MATIAQIQTSPRRQAKIKQINDITVLDSINIGQDVSLDGIFDTKPARQNEDALHGSTTDVNLTTDTSDAVSVRLAPSESTDPANHNSPLKSLSPAAHSAPKRKASTSIDGTQTDEPAAKVPKLLDVGREVKEQSLSSKSRPVTKVSRNPSQKIKPITAKKPKKHKKTPPVPAIPRKTQAPKPLPLPKKPRKYKKTYPVPVPTPARVPLAPKILHKLNRVRDYLLHNPGPLQQRVSNEDPSLYDVPEITLLAAIMRMRLDYDLDHGLTYPQHAKIEDVQDVIINQYTASVRQTPEQHWVTLDLKRTSALESEVRTKIGLENAACLGVNLLEVELQLLSSPQTEVLRGPQVSSAQEMREFVEQCLAKTREAQRTKVDGA